MHETDLAELGSPSNPVIVRLSEYKGVRFVDVRRYYRKKGTRELLPTKKGITLGERLLADLKEVLEKSNDTIQEWLSGAHTTADVEAVRAHMQARVKAVENAARSPKKLEVRLAARREPNFFGAHSEGNIDVIELNSNHPITKQIQSAVTETSKSATIKTLGTLLATYYRAKNRFDDVEEVQPAQLFEALEYEWGVILKNYLEAGG